MKALKIVFALLLLLGAQQLYGQNPLVGTWEIKNDSLRSIKIITPTHWAVFTEALFGEHNLFIRSHGGSYTLNGNKYTEHIQVASWDSYGNEKADFTIKLEDDRLYLEGPLTLGDGTIIPIKEVWQKVKTDKAYPRNPAVGTWNQLSMMNMGADGTQEFFTQDMLTCFEIISPTHWIQLNHYKQKFESAFGGTYSLHGNKMRPELTFASFPYDKSRKIEITQKVSKGKRYITGVISTPEGERALVFDVVAEKIQARSQKAKNIAIK